MAELRLEVRDYADATRWRWVLTGPGGEFLADHEVRLDPSCWQYEAFTDLLGYLTWHAAPDRFEQDEARIVAEVGQWIGTEVFGPLAPALLRARPATIRVIVPAEALALCFRPLELAHASGRPLSVQDVTLVMDPASADNGLGFGAVDHVGPAGERLRVLGLFSLPEGGQPLNLRRERYALVRLIEGIAATGRAADVRVLQYGVTRDRLHDVLTESEGWDVIHISGHGAPGELLLEDASGRPDKVTAAELADLLDLARERVSLVTVAACWSAALTAAEQRRLLGLPLPEQRQAQAAATPDGEARRVGERDATEDFEPGALATELTSRLGCAVLAMRYPVGDDFAIALTGKLYELLAAKGQPLPRAVALTLRELMTKPASQAWPALSAATPALFGARAASLRLAAPSRAQPDDYRTATLKLSGFPPQPDRFVGRTGVMARASAALAAESGIPGVLLHGMPGGGKTACALELAYTHEHAFDRLVWFKAPDEGQDIRGALADFALTLENELPGFQMAHLLADPAKLTAFLPALTELAERRRVLIVIDNAESLLTDGGHWRDDRWGQVVGALSVHHGLGRVVVTTRRVPAGAAGLRVLTIDALSLDEALLLARELPHLSTLIRGELPGVGSDVSRRLALGVLNVAQGHPKLLELADGQAADPERLNELVTAGDSAWREQGGLPAGFFHTGQARASAADYLHVLAAWTAAVTGTLEPGVRTLFWFLCCLEESDRERPVLGDNWADLWTRLELDGQPPGLDETLTVIEAQGLVAIRPETAAALESYALHPGIAAAGRAQAGTPFQDAVDTEAAMYWDAVRRYAGGENDDGAVRTGLLVRAGLAAVPYLMRARQWEAAGSVLDGAFVLDPSRTNAAAVLPAIQEIADHEARYGSTLAMALAVLDPAVGERQLRAYLDASVARGDYEAASVTAGRLGNLYLDGGRLVEALALTEQKVGYTRQAGYGPWTQLADAVRRLQVLNAMGQAESVLTEVQKLRVHMDNLPVTSGRNEVTPAWSVREYLFDAGRYAARQLGRWQDTLDLNGAKMASQRERGASAEDIAGTRFNDYGPLLMLGRLEDALALLLECRQVFQDVRDIRSLGKTLDALAAIESYRGHGQAAIDLARDALRYAYLAGDVHGITVSYHNLGGFLRHRAQPLAAILACHLASALICALTGVEGTDASVRAAAADLSALGTAAALPEDTFALSRQIGDIPGTDLPGLIAALTPDPAAADQALRDLIAQAQALAAPPDPAPAQPA